ncbi:MAG: hypothetical protein H0W02_21505 [Ktedonobacteraceae bacterium]|nr:hypothetical protein [Ktedonobacteraceae bacterium]
MFYYYHCYAQVDWVGHTGGAYTEIDPYGSLNCPGCNGFIDNEMWLADPNSSQCANIPIFKACWVESGISTWGPNNPNSCNQGHDSTCVFWADERPNGGKYHEHPLFNIGPDGTSLDPWYFFITIENHNNASSSSGIWDVSVAVFKNGNYFTTKSAQSVFGTGNSMNANIIRVGSELSAVNGASASRNYFNYNEWLQGNGSFTYQTQTAVNTSTNPPPNGAWNVYPCNCSGNTGGSWETWD